MSPPFHSPRSPHNHHHSPRVPMHLFHKTLSAPSSSSSSSPCWSTTTNDGRSSSSFDKREQSSSFTERRLTRQRKLRHATDEELGLNFLTDGVPVSPRTIPDRYRSCSAVPLPLPLPESLMARRRPPESSCSHPGGQPETSSPVKSTLSRSPPSCGNPRRARSNDSHVGYHSYQLPRLHIPARSAPASGLSTPNVSPRRLVSGDRFLFCNHHNSNDPYHMVKPNSAPTSGYTTPTLCSPDHSPLHSPDMLHNHGTCIRPKKSDKFQPSFRCQVTAHPLPRPPSPTPASVLSQPAVVPSPPRVVVHRAEGGVALWQKGRLIGRGTYGSVYHGTNRLTGASCAIKEVDIIPDDPQSNECVKQLEQEISVLSQLQHPNIVQYYGCETVDDHFNIYLEYVHPGSLSKYVHEHCGNMTESIVRNFTRHILCGLAYLHSRKTIHRDIKGANLLVDQSGTVKLADFGMAKHLTGLSTQLSMKGSPHWMAPELMKAVMQNESNPDLACAVDIWSLGCTIIEMFTSKPPWGDLEGPQAMFKVLNRSPAIPENLSPEGKDFLSRCFRRDPAERPPASMLLEHSFVRNCDDLNVSIHSSRTNSTDKSPNPRSLRYSPRETDWICGPKSNYITSSTRARSVPRTPCSPSPPHHSHWSMFEARPSPSNPQPTPGLHNFSSSTNRLLSLDSANNHPLALSRARGREVPHI